VLRAVERRVEAVHQRFRRFAGVVGDRDADAHRQRDVSARRADDHLADRPAQPLGDVQRAVDAGARHEHPELLAAGAGDVVDAAPDLPQHAADLAQHRVAGRVAEAVVDVLEVVDVDRQHSVALPITAQTLGLVVQPLLDRAPVQETGEAVVLAAVAQHHDEPDQHEREQRAVHEQAADHQREDRRGIGRVVGVHRSADRLRQEGGDRRAQPEDAADQCERQRATGCGAGAEFGRQVPPDGPRGTQHHVAQPDRNDADLGPRDAVQQHQRQHAHRDDPRRELLRVGRRLPGEALDAAAQPHEPGEQQRVREPEAGPHRHAVALGDERERAGDRRRRDGPLQRRAARQAQSGHQPPEAGDEALLEQDDREDDESRLQLRFGRSAPCRRGRRRASMIAFSAMPACRSSTSASAAPPSRAQA
jgi:hypothetical protein